MIEEIERYNVLADEVRKLGGQLNALLQRLDQSAERATNYVLREDERIRQLSREIPVAFALDEAKDAAWESEKAENKVKQEEYTKEWRANTERCWIEFDAINRSLDLLIGIVGKRDRPQLRASLKKKGKQR